MLSYFFLQTFFKSRFTMSIPSLVSKNDLLVTKENLKQNIPDEETLYSKAIEKVNFSFTNAIKNGKEYVSLVALKDYPLPTQQRVYKVLQDNGYTIYNDFTTTPPQVLEKINRDQLLMWYSFKLKTPDEISSAMVCLV